MSAQRQAATVPIFCGSKKECAQGILHCRFPREHIQGSFLVSFSKLFPRGLPEDVFLPVSAGTSEVVSVEP